MIGFNQEVDAPEAVNATPTRHGCSSSPAAGSDLSVLLDAAGYQAVVDAA